MKLVKEENSSEMTSVETGKVLFKLQSVFQQRQHEEILAKLKKSLLIFRQSPYIGLRTTHL